MSNDQIEIFESPDIEDPIELSYNDVKIIHNDTSNDQLLEEKSIISQQVDLNDSFKIFSKERFSTKTKNYSDSINKPQRSIRRKPFNTSDSISIEEETPLQKYTRLKFEISQFIKDINDLKIDENDDDDDDEKVEPSQLIEQLQILQNELSSIDPLSVKVGDKASLFSSSSSDTKALLDLLKYSKENNIKEQTSPSDKDTKNLYYELFFSKDSSNFMHLSKIADLDQRIHQIEKHFSDMANDVSSRGILNVIDDLKGHIESLTPSYIMNLSSQLDSLVTKYQSIEEMSLKKDNLSSEDEKKIDELYEISQNLISKNSELNNVVNRLVQLKSIHERAAEYTDHIQYILNEQSKMGALLERNEIALKTVQENLESNILTIQNNMKQLEERINK